jgi:hypothetical protein
MGQYLPLEFLIREPIAYLNLHWATGPLCWCRRVAPSLAARVAAVSGVPGPSSCEVVPSRGGTRGTDATLVRRQCMRSAGTD